MPAPAIHSNSTRFRLFAKQVISLEASQIHFVDRKYDLFYLGGRGFHAKHRGRRRIGPPKSQKDLSGLQRLSEYLVGEPKHAWCGPQPRGDSMLIAAGGLTNAAYFADGVKGEDGKFDDRQTRFLVDKPIGGR